MKTQQEERHGLKRIFMGPVAVIAVWFSTHVGPGFAGGAQQVRYFIHDGYLGVVIGPIVLTILAIWTSYWFSEFSRATNSYQYRTFYDNFFGKFKILFSNVKEVSSIIGITVSVALVYATGGQLLGNLLNISPVIAGVFSTIVVGILVMYGEQVVRSSATIITFILVILVIYIGLVSLPKAMPNAIAYMDAKTINTTPGAAWYNIFLYFPLFVSYLDAGMVTSEGVIRSRKDSLILAVGGSVLLGAALIMMNLIFAAGMPGIDNEELPTLWALNNVVGTGRTSQILYTAFAWLALVSTGVGGMSGWVKRMDDSLAKTERFAPVKMTVRRGILTFVAIGVSISFGQFGIMNLVYYGYGMMCTINLYFFLIPMFFLIPWRIKKLKEQNGGALDSGDTN